MKKAVVFLIVFSIGTGPFLAQVAINANNLDKSFQLRLEHISAGIFYNNRLDYPSLEKWKTLVFELQKRGKYDWNSLVQFILDKFKQHTAKKNLIPSTN